MWGGGELGWGRVMGMGGGAWVGSRETGFDCDIGCVGWEVHWVGLRVLGGCSLVGCIEQGWDLGCS